MTAVYINMTIGYLINIIYISKYDIILLTTLIYIHRETKYTHT